MMDKEEYGFLADDMHKVEFLQQAIQDYINDGGVADIDPFDPSPSERETLVEYFHHFYALMEYSGILYTRLRLINDEKYVGIETAIAMVCNVLGMTEEENVNTFCANMQQECKDALSDLTGVDMDSYEGIDVEFKW